MFLMQARSSDTGEMVTWTSEEADWEAAGWPGPGDPEEIAISGREAGGGDSPADAGGFLGATSVTFTASADTPDFAAAFPGPQIVNVDSSGHTGRVLLPEGVPPGTAFLINDLAGAAATNNITVSKTISGGDGIHEPAGSNHANVVMAINGQSLLVVKHLSNRWLVVSRYPLA